MPSSPHIAPQKRHKFASAFFLVATVLLSQSNSLFSQTSIADLNQNFHNPPDDAKPMMRWWWFGGAVTKPELEKELQDMHNAGIGGVEIQPVYPLALDDESKGIKNLPYLSPEFLDAISFANKTARSLGMRVDITLGSGWPYGGPHTTLNQSAGRLKIVALPITSSTIYAPQLQAGESLIASFYASGTPDSYQASTAKPLPNTSNPIIVPSSTSGDRVALLFIASHTKQTVKRPSVGAEGLVLDHFSRTATDEHLADVAAPLIKAFGNQPPYAVFSDSLEVYGADWTRNLPAEFQKRRGYDIVPHLPELAAGGSPQADAIRHDWGQTLSDLIRENYLTPINTWATNHNTKFRSQTYGVPAVTLADEVIPALPEGEGPQWRAFSFTRWASSASHLYHRNVTSAETFTWLHSPAFRATPLDMKVEADRMFLLGVNQVIGHGWPYSPPSAGEPGWNLYAAAAFNTHNPWFSVMPDISRYIQRVSWLLRQGEPANDVAILLPENDAQASFTPGHASITELMKQWITPELMSTILNAGYNIDYIDATTINKLGIISYSILILPPTDRIPLATYKKMGEYASRGGRVVAIEKVPSIAPGFLDQAENLKIQSLSTQLFHSKDHKGILLSSLSNLTETLHRALPPDVAVVGQTTDFGFIHRKLPTSDIYFVVNSSNQPIHTTIRFRAPHPITETWNADTAETNLVASRTGTQIPLSLAPYESRIFVLGDAPTHRSITTSDFTEGKSIDFSSNWQIRFANDASTQYLPQFTSWTDLTGHQFYSGEATYTNNFTVPANPGHTIIDFGQGTATIDTRPPNSSGIHALLDPPIHEAAVIYVNEQRVGSLWHPPYRLDITPFAHAGSNTLEVRVTNTAINELAGQPPRDYTSLNAKFGKRFDPQDMDNLKPIPSGLFGPIKILVEEPAK
ncbi:glycosyl hydrolase [Tunturiibacter lichenicola]|uniref:glycosyl hydrolase n=1 Tax=Tunturiibacter lichenicola TaxID=2051959 RepID=UPI003D9BFB73